MKEKQVETISDRELVEFFNITDSIQEKLEYFSKIQDDDIKIELLNTIPEKEKYKFIGKIRTPRNIAMLLNGLADEKSKAQTFNYIAKQFKGNNDGILKILTQIDFDVTIPPSMLHFRLNNINSLSLDFLINIQKHVSNYSEMKFKINEYESDSIDIEYSFSEISAIIAKIEELTADIPEEMDEANKFYTIYSRLTGMMIYDNGYLLKQSKARNEFNEKAKENRKKAKEKYERELKEIRRSPAGLYGGLIDGKAICAGYALILHETLKYVGLKSLYVIGYIPKEDGHAWNQVQIDGKWYNCDPTWDSQRVQMYGKYKYMLLDDKDFRISHGKFLLRRTKTEHKCRNKFDYSKIQGLLPSQIENAEKRESTI